MMFIMVAGRFDDPFFVSLWSSGPFDYSRVVARR